jgi:hypothetical protein
MNQNTPTGLLAREVADRVLSAIYGPDLTGCQISPEAIATIVQEALDAQTQREKTIIDLFVQVLEKIELVATPPDRSQVKDTAHLAAILGERADGVHTIVTQTLSAWRKLNASGLGQP